jgi:hypothetical protein
MEKEKGLSKYEPEKYWVKLFSNEEELKITPEQYKIIKSVLLDKDTKFIEINGRIINISSIDQIIPGEIENRRGVWDE